MGNASFKKYCRVIIRLLHGVLELVVRFLLGFVYGGPGEKMPPIKNLLLLESASGLAIKIRTKKITSVEVVNSFIDRITEINPILNCVVDERFMAAKQEAEEADEFIRSGIMNEIELASRKPFLGVPFSTKDCLAVKDMIHTAGLYKRKDIVGQEDADSIKKLREAGAIPLALTNVSELCMWWESNNTVHGRTSNPYNTNHIVGGSSGGEGCVQAAAGTAFGIGSDIGGSIRIPAFFNGIFGHKPTELIVSNKGQYPIPVSHEQDCFNGIGPMCRRAEDLLPLLKIIAGKNSDLLRLDETVDIKDIKFFYQENDMGQSLISPVQKEIREKLHDIVNHLHKAYKIKAEKIENKHFRKSLNIWLSNMKAKDSPSFSQQLVNLEGDINIYLELVKWFFCVSRHTFIGLGTALVEKYGVKYGSDLYNKMVREKELLQLELALLLGDNGVLLYPTHPTAAPYHLEPFIKPFNFAYTAIINILGFPATHCPLGLNEEGLPIGIQVIANKNQDRLCLAVARELEKVFGGWVPPSIDC